ISVSLSVCLSASKLQLIYNKYAIICKSLSLISEDLNTGWSQECLQEWGSFMRLAIPSMLMLCIEWWTFEIGSFLSGITVHMALAAIFYVLVFQFPLGYAAAVNVRVGNALGAGKTEQAKKSCKVACVFGGIVKGAGKQKIGAICNLTGYYIIGLPIGVSLMFAAHMGVLGEDFSLNVFISLVCVRMRSLGLWIGLLVCVFTQCIFFLILVLKFDWKLLTEEVNGFCLSDFIKLPDRVPYTPRAFVADVTTIQ
uniref:Uncharacterized protein n=1 Tax=Erpetoichthys calabaricus TaxID=27687 RepID=A0A8C4S3B2_ERPCA